MLQMLKATTSEAKVDQSRIVVYATALEFTTSTRQQPGRLCRWMCDTHEVGGLQQVQPHTDAYQFLE